MSQAASAPVKVCVNCNQDVSKKPRVKDPQGRYLCEPCFAATQAAPAKPAASPPQRAAAQPASKPAPKPAPKPQDDNPLLDAIDTGEGEGGDMLLPEGYDPSLALAAATAKPEAPVRAHQPKPQAGAKGKKGPLEFKCRHCGYNMAGAMSMRCPECGKMNMEPKNDVLADTAREVRMQTYRRPFILMGIGWTLSLIILAVGKVGWEAYAALGIGWLVAIPVGVLTFWVCSLIFLEYDAPFHITALRLAGIYACVGVSDAIGYAIGMRVFGFASLALMILLYMTELEMERWEAIAMAIAGGVIKIILMIGIALGLAALFVGAGAVSGLGGPAPVPLVSPSDPNRTQFFDADGDGRDDDTGIVIPADAMPEDLLPPADGSQPPVDGDGGGADDGGE
ncbi:MAG TPA: hypothetical protein VHN77_03205 [Phycisphaerales bacterium]|nr:hypothetical protein [Phycisphaerales bacterium]